MENIMLDEKRKNIKLCGKKCFFLNNLMAMPAHSICFDDTVAKSLAIALVHNVKKKSQYRHKLLIQGPRVIDQIWILV